MEEIKRVWEKQYDANEERRAKSAIRLEESRDSAKLSKQKHAHFIRDCKQWKGHWEESEKYSKRLGLER